MSTYSKLPGDTSKGPSKQIQDLSNSVTDYEKKLKDLRKLFTEAKGKSSKETSKAIMSKQDDLINLANSIRSLMKSQIPSSEKQIFDKLKKTAEQLFKQFSDLEQDQSRPKDIEASLGPEFVQSEEISFQNAGELDSEVLQDRLQDIQNIQKDFHEVNNLFKEVAGLVEQQGALLNESEKNVDTAVVETARANVELESANTYQRSAKKKAVCIFVIVLCVVGALVGIVVATT